MIQSSRETVVWHELTVQLSYAAQRDPCGISCLWKGLLEILQ
jgi:hypothetical protein